MDFKISTLASSSKGNCTFITNGQHTVLIDMGIGLSRIKKELINIGSNIADVDGILITHEHADHVVGLKDLCGSSINIYAHDKVRDILRVKSDDKLSLVDTYDYENGFDIGSLHIEPFRIPHDSIYPMAYRIMSGNTCFVYATDVGEVNPGVYQNIIDADIAVVEANHDVKMLMNGRYTPSLKRRILSSSGHLSNAKSAELVENMAKSRLKKVILAHLSENNNLPELAYNEVTTRLIANGARVGQDIDVEVAMPRSHSRILEV